MVSQLGTLQRKIRFQKWKYVFAGIILSLAGISVTAMNASPHENPMLLHIRPTPSVESSPSSSPINFFQIITSLDQRRREAFEKKDIFGLSHVNHPGSIQAELDEKMLKQIIKQNLTIEFINAHVMSVEPISNIRDSSTEVTLEVRDRVNGVERLWKVTLVRQESRSWRFSLVTLVPPSMQTVNPDEQRQNPLL